MTSVLEQAKQLKDLKLSKECGDGLPTKQNHTRKQTNSLVSAVRKMLEFCLILIVFFHTLLLSTTEISFRYTLFTT